MFEEVVEHVGRRLKYLAVGKGFCVGVLVQSVGR